MFAIHSDPATNSCNPAGPDRDRAASSQRLQEWIDHWSQHGFGYWTVQSTSDAAVVGFAGVRHSVWFEQPVLNLYYRFGPTAWGRGFAAEAARHATRLATKHFPGLPVLARTKPANIPPQRTALAAGLTRRADLDRDDGTGVGTILVTHWLPDAHS